MNVDPMLDMHSQDRPNFGHTGPFEFHFRSVTTAGLANTPEEAARIKEYLAYEVKFKVDKALAEHLMAITADSREYAVKIYRHPWREVTVSRFMQTERLYRINGYVVLMNPEEAVVGEYARLEDFGNVAVPFSMGSQQFRVGRHVFKQHTVGGVHFYRCIAILETRPLEAWQFSAEPDVKEADATWRTIEKLKLPVPPAEL